jgi:hypothetical protein
VQVRGELGFVIALGLLDQSTDAFNLVENLGAFLAERESVGGTCFRICPVAAKRCSCHFSVVLIPH